MTGVSVSVLVVSWNTREDTRRCLESLPAGGETGHEVIVVDNGSRDGSAEMLAARDDITLIRNSANRGFAEAVNQAYAQAKGDLILLLNSDAQLHPGALDALVGFLHDRPDAAGVSPLFLNPDGTFQPFFRRLPTFASALVLATGLQRLPGLRRTMGRSMMAGEDFSRPRPVEQPPAACLLLRREVLGPTRILDERLPIYYNDVLLAHDLAAAGHRLWMTPDAVVSHVQGASTHLLDPDARRRHHLGGLVRYLRATEPRWRTILFGTVVFCDHLARRVLRTGNHLPLRDLLAALRGDTGPLPDGDRREWLVMFSGSPWWLGCHRQHALAGHLAGERRVLFVDPPGRRVRWRPSARRVGESVWHVTPPQPLPFGRQVPPVNRLNRRAAGAYVRRWLRDRPGTRVLWLDEDLAAPVVGALGEKAVVHDVTDLGWTFTRRWNRWHLRRAARSAAQAADLVIASSPELPARMPATARPPVVVANGCDPERFAVDGPVADWVTRLPGPRLGYVGGIEQRAFDGELLAAVARCRPEWTFVLLGPWTRRGRAPLRGLPNVHCPGLVPFDQVPAILRGCEVCLLPYRVGGLIDYVQPKKLYEYLALGKPVVATPLPALTRLDDGLVELAAGPDGFVAAVERALEGLGDSRAQAARRAAAVANSWSARADTLHTLLAGLTGKGAR